MILRLREYDQFPSWVSLAPVDGSWTFVYEGVNSIADLGVEVEVNKTDEDFYCRGTVECLAEIECSRCLDPYKIRLAQEIDFFAVAQTSERVTRHDDAEDYVVFQGQDLVAPLDDIVRQAIILALPAKPLCKEDCAGLCTGCGVNLNRTTCSCKKDAIDPRWEGLQRIEIFGNKEQEG
jgi:uncharacterized protein